MFRTVCTSDQEKNPQIIQTIISFFLRPSEIVANLNDQACLQEGQLLNLTGEAKAVEVVSAPGLTEEGVVGLYPQRNSAGTCTSDWNPLDRSREEAEEGVCWDSLR